jgi:hypothetical protein
MGKHFFVLGIVITLMSCGKDIDLFIPKTNQAGTGNISRLMARLQSDMEGDISTTRSCPCHGNITFEIDKDLVLDIPPDFVDLNLYPCTNGYFNLSVTVCDRKGEILVSGIPTVSEGKLLESRIEFNVQVSDGPIPVRLAHDKQLRFMVNDPDPRERMELFYGSGDKWIQADQNPNTWDNVFNSEWWIQEDSTQTIISGFGYECFSDSMKWINVDVFFEVPADQRTMVCITLPEEFTNTNTAVFLVFDDYRSILALRGDPEIKQFCEPYAATPIGFRATFVVMSEMGENEYYFASKHTTITTNHSEAIIPLKTPYGEIKNFINSL